jgi:hypothetical protein
MRHLASVLTQAGAGGVAPAALVPSASLIFRTLCHQMNRHMALAGAAQRRAAGATAGAGAASVAGSATLPAVVADSAAAEACTAGELQGA